MRTRAVLILVAAVSIASTLLRTNDLSLYTDSTRYLIWAQSLSQGKGWVDETQPVAESYVVNAPLYPLLLVPSQWLRPGSIESAKALTALFAAAAYLLFFVLVRRLMDHRTAGLLTLILMLLPMSFVLSTEVLSESSYLLFVFAALVLIERPSGGTVERVRWPVVALLAVLPLVREIGIALTASVVVGLALERRWRDAGMITVAAAAVAGLWLVRNLVVVGTPEASQAANVSFMFQRMLTSPDEPLAVEFLRRFSANASAYRYELGGMILFPIPFTVIASPSGLFAGIVAFLQSVKGFAPLLFAPAVLYGAWRDLRTGSGGLVRVLFVVLSLFVVLLYPVQDVRLLYPVAPFILIFLARTVHGLITYRRIAGTVVGIGAAALVALAALLTDLEVVRTNLHYREALADPDSLARRLPRTGYFSTPWRAAGERIGVHAPPSAVLAASAKEIAPFAGGRKVLEINKAVPRPLFERMLRDHDVSVLVATEPQPGVPAWLFAMRESQTFRFDPLASFGTLHIFSVRSVLSHPGPAPGLGQGAVSLRSDSLLIAARTSIINGQHERAAALLGELVGSDPENAEAAFQLVVARALAGDLPGTLEAQQTLFRAPRSTSYLSVARILLDGARSIAHARGSGPAPARSASAFVAGRMALDLGYERQAASLFGESVSLDPNAFEPLVWSAHLAIRAGDEERARQLLRAASVLDAANPIVAGLSTVLTSSVHAARSDTATAMTAWIEVSRAYESIGLVSDAIDAALRARGAARSAPEPAVRLLELAETHQLSFLAARLSDSVSD